MLRPSVGPSVLIVIVFAAVANGAPEQVLHTVAKINYKSIDFDSTPDDVESKLPTATINHAHPGSDDGVTTFEVWDDPIIDCVLLRFSGEQLIEIQYIYFPTKVAMMGGAEAIDRLALSEYGQPTERAELAMRWDFPSIDRAMEISQAGGKWTHRVFHRSQLLSYAVYPHTTANPRKAGIHVARGARVPTSRSSNSQRSNSVIDIPPNVQSSIERNARLDHPDDEPQQAYEIAKQVKAYRTLMQMSCPNNLETREFTQLKARISGDHPADYSTQLFVLKKQLSAYALLQEMESPEGMARSHFYRLKQSAARKHPGDYSTQVYVLRRDINKYLHYRQTGNSGDAIMSHLRN